MMSDEKAGIECRWAPPEGVKLEELTTVPVKARCHRCFIEASINVSVTAPKAGQAQTLARRALEKELRFQGCQHQMPSSIAGREALPQSWFP